MTTFVALLRGINVGGKAVIGMSALREVLEAQGLHEVKTLLQSGNVIFQAEGSPAAHEKRLESSVKKQFGHDVSFMIRTASEWQEIIAANPFPQEAQDDPSHLLVLFLKGAASATHVASLKGAIIGREYFHRHGRELYLVYPDGIGHSKLTSALLERRLGTAGTGRNWNTVQKIAAQL